MRLEFHAVTVLLDVETVFLASPPVPQVVVVVRNVGTLVVQLVVYAVEVA